MSVLFLSSENKINEQEQLLMLSLLENSHPFILACPENSILATMANSCNIPFMEISKSSWGQFFSLRNYLKKNPIRNIHVLDKTALKVAQYLNLSLGKSLKIIASHHDPINDFNTQEAAISSDACGIQGFLAKKVHILFVSSPELFNTLQSQKIADKKIELLHYAVNLNKAFPDEALCQNLVKHNPNKRFIFLLDTSFEESSGIELLFEALVNLKEHLNPKDPTIEVHICGTGSLFHELMEKAHELGIAPMLAFFGNNDCQVFYKNSDAIICPATSGEGDYRSILNGWMSSLPVISSDISVHTKLILSGKSNQSALIYPRDSAETLTQCMLQLIHKKPVRESLIATGKEMLPISRYETLEMRYLKTLRNFS